MSIRFRRAWHQTWSFSTGSFIAGGIMSAVIAWLFYFLGLQTLHIVFLSVACGVATVAVLMAGTFLLNCLRWHDLDEPPRRLKWKQRQKIAKALSSNGPRIVSMYL